MDLRNLNSFFGEGVVLKGSLKFKGLLRFDGNFEGDIESDDTFMVGSSGKVSANIKTGFLYNFGEIKGDIEASNKISLHANSKLTGNIKSPILITEELAFFEGSCSMPPPMAISEETSQKTEIPIVEPEIPVVSANGADERRNEESGKLGKVAAMGIGVVLIAGFAGWIIFFQRPQLALQSRTASSSTDSANHERPDPVEKLREEGIEAFNNRDWKLAVSKFDAVVEARENDEPALLKLGAAAVNAKQDGKALEAYEKLAVINPGLETLGALADLYEKAGRKAELVSTLEKMNNMSPGDKNISRKLKKLTEVKVAKKVDIAEKLKKEIRKNPQDPEFRIKLAEHYLHKGNYVEALAVLKKGVNDFPAKENVRSLYANTLHRTGKEREALEQYVTLAKNNPDIMEAGNNLAFSQLNKGLLTEASASFTKTLERDPDNFRGMLGLAMVYSKLEENDKAEAECRKILDRAGDYAPAMNRLAWIYAKQGINLNKAESLSKKSLSIFNDIPEYIDTLSEINFKKGNNDEAIRLIKKAVKLIPGDPYYKRQLFKFRRAKSQS
ncbi:hypothetical protein MNBD_NITROSPINAE04-2059 [hydrothermal vent metagenome]|uniref:Tetratricopeptide repeat protein n=1 Tax=hydrothermal vent metagenome TaxID=652676 RepID=A0A3B1BU75_9ZZZZ